jgi:hypothetical protein
MPESGKASSFERSLQLMDRYLYVRWGGVMNQWVIERKAYLPLSEIEFLRRRQARFTRWCNEFSEGPKLDQCKHLLQEITEELESAKNGRRVIIYTRELDRRVFDMLVRADMQRFGGYSRFADEVERLAESSEAKQARAHENQIADLNREVYDQMDFIERRRSTDLAEGKSMREMLSSGTRVPKAPDAPLRVVDKRVVQPEAGEVATL